MSGSHHPGEVYLVKCISASDGRTILFEGEGVKVTLMLDEPTDYYVAGEWYADVYVPTLASDTSS